MGRVKIDIKKLESTVGKQVTYSKRRGGLEKKARELATLCDIDIVLILFSPAGKLSWTNGSKSAPEEVLMRFASLAPQERAKRKLEALEQLKRVFKKLDHDVNIEEYMRQLSSTQNVEELHQRLQALQMHSLHLQQRLSSYETFTTIEQAENLERSLQDRLQKIHSQKQILESSEHVVSFNQAVGEQFYQEGLLDSGVLDTNAQQTWEEDQSQHGVLALHHESKSMIAQRDSNGASECTSSLPASMLHYGKQMESTDHGCGINLYSALKKMVHHDEQKREKTGIEVNVDCSNVVEYGDGNATSLSNTFLPGNRIPLLWQTSANDISSNGMISAQPTRYQFPQQQPFELDDSANGCPLRRQLELFRPQSSSGVAHSTREYNFELHPKACRFL